MKQGISYLCIPYTWNPEKSFEIANEISAWLMRQGYVVFSPISHSHPISEHLKEVQLDHDFWMKQDLSLLYVCERCFVTIIGGRGHSLLKESKGCQRELFECDEKGIGKTYIYYDNGKIIFV